MFGRKWVFSSNWTQSNFCLCWNYRGGENIFFLYPSKFSAGASMTKDKLTREKHTNLFNTSFIWHRSLHKEIKTKEIFKPGCCDARFHEEWRFVEKCNRTKGPELSVVNRETASPVHSDSFQRLSVFGNKDAPFLWVQKGHLSHEGLMTCFRGRSENSSHTHCFSHFFSLRYFICQRAVFWGSKSWTSANVKQNYKCKNKIQINKI